MLKNMCKLLMRVTIRDKNTDVGRWINGYRKVDKGNNMQDDIDGKKPYFNNKLISMLMLLCF